MTNWLHEQRLAAVQTIVRDRQARSVLDLGCGDGDLLIRLLGDGNIDRIMGVDLCLRSLARLRDRLGAEGTVDGCRIELVHGSLLDARSCMQGFDCATLVETIEHIDADRLGTLESAVLAFMRPKSVIITTPNAEFNCLLGVPPLRFRHPDHRFEWDRIRFRRWAMGVAERHGYKVICSDIAGQHPKMGGASQMAVFDLPDDQRQSQVA